MIFKIIQNELRYRFKLISTYVYFFIFFSLSFLIMNVAGGAIPGAQVNMFRSGENVFVNTPVTISMLTVALFYFSLIIVASVFGNTAVKEFEENSFSLFFTKPIKKSTFIIGKFLSAVLVNLFIFSSIGIGFFIATLMPYLEATKIGPNHLLSYLQPYYLFIIPNLLFTGSIFFMLALFSRKLINAYIGAISLFLGYMAATSLSSDFTNMKIVSLLDPFGLSTGMLLVRYWSPAQINTDLFSIQGDLLYNRLLWIGIGLIIFITFLKLFKMSYTIDFKKKVVKQKKAMKIPEITLVKNIKLNYNKVLYPLYRWTIYEFKSIVSNLYFLIIIVGYLFFLITTATQLGSVYGTTTYPVTYIILEMLTGNYLLFSLIVSTFYAGELIWKERINKSDQIMDTMPFKDGIAFFSKLFSILLVQLLLVSFIIIVGVITQAVQGYYHFHFSQYFFDLFILRFPSIIVYALLAMFMQVIFNNKYVGYFAVIAVYGLLMVMGMLSITHNLLMFNSAPSFSYSEMNGYGHYLLGFFSFKFYWFLFSFILGLIGLKLWLRGKETSLMIRYKNSQNNKKITNKVIYLTIGLFLVVGGYLFYNTNILNEYHRPKTYEKIYAKYEKKYKYLNKLVQPRITDVSVKLDLTPSTRDISVKGKYVLKNKTNNVIKNIVVNYNPEIKDYQLTFSSKTVLLQKDKDFGLSIYKLENPLLPGDSISLAFQGNYREKGISNERASTSLVNNGTFLHNDFFPSIGYNSSYELQGVDARKQQGLPKKERMAKIDNQKARNNVYVSSDADWVNFEAVISTENGQIAIAPGDLIKDWVEGNRHYYHYKLNSPALNFFTFVSGRYEVKKGHAKGVDIEIYYHKDHTYNIDTMLTAAEKSLTYCIENFNSYPHKVLRIVEVPRYISYAQSIPTMIPFSEGLGFIAKVNPDNPKDVDYPYYVTAHEVSHQWWAHQVIGADVQGSTIMSEALAQYTSLMCMKQKYGKEKMGRFLRYELDSYLQGRSNESRSELPLYLVENQQYIHYNKGSLVMYSLQDLIGEKQVNEALGKFCKDFAYRNPPYPISTDFLPYIYDAMPDSLKSIGHDLFEKIVLFDYGIKDLNIKEINKTNYQLTIQTENKKVEADSMGKEVERPLNEYVDIAVYNEDNPIPVLIQKIHIYDKKQKIIFNVKTKPEKVIIDPYCELIDKNRENNEKTTGFKKVKKEKKEKVSAKVTL